jgi:hypothetical protein
LCLEREREERILMLIYSSPITKIHTNTHTARREADGQPCRGLRRGALSTLKIFARLWRRRREGGGQIKKMRVRERECVYMYVGK